MYTTMAFNYILIFWSFITLLYFKKIDTITIFKNVFRHHIVYIGALGPRHYNKHNYRQYTIVIYPSWVQNFFWFWVHGFTSCRPVSSTQECKTKSNTHTLYLSVYISCLTTFWHIFHYYYYLNRYCQSKTLANKFRFHHVCVYCCSNGWMFKKWILQYCNCHLY